LDVWKIACQRKDALKEAERRSKKNLLKKLLEREEKPFSSITLPAQKRDLQDCRRVRKKKERKKRKEKHPEKRSNYLQVIVRYLQVIEH